MLRKLSIVAALVVGVVVLTAINKEFVPKIDPDGVKRQEEEKKRIKDLKERVKKDAEQQKAKESAAGGETVDVSHILIKVSGDEAAWAEAKKKIDAIRARIMAGEDFAAVAREVSEDPGSKKSGGAYPNTPRGMMVPEFEKVMFETPVGQVSEPFRTKFGWHILKVTGRHGQPTPDHPDKEAKSNEKPSAEVAATPDVYKVKFDTTKGAIVIECHKDWAPLAAARFYELVQQKYYDQNKFFRIAKGFVVQWGLAADPAVSNKWEERNLKDEPAKEPNRVGTISFAKGGPDTRTTQVFINLNDNSAQLDAMGFAVFGKVVEGMDVVNALNGKYGEAPDQTQIRMRGNAYLDASFPGLDEIKTATIVP